MTGPAPLPAAPESAGSGAPFPAAPAASSEPEDDPLSDDADVADATADACSVDAVVSAGAVALASPQVPSHPQEPPHPIICSSQDAIRREGGPLRPRTNLTSAEAPEFQDQLSRSSKKPTHQHVDTGSVPPSVTFTRNQRFARVTVYCVSVSAPGSGVLAGLTVHAVQLF